MLSISVDFIESKEMGEKIYRQKNSFDFKFAFQNFIQYNANFNNNDRSNNLIFSEYPKRRKEIFF